MGSKDITSCPDCLAWGTSQRHLGGLCVACYSFRHIYGRPDSPGGIGPCPTCHRTLTLGIKGICRLCQKQTDYYRRKGEPWDPVAANKHGQQLFFADLPLAPRAAQRPPAVTPARIPEGGFLARGAQHPLFPAPFDLKGHGRPGLHRRADPADAAFFDTVIAELAEQNHWTTKLRRETRSGVRVALGLQDSRRAPVLASTITQLREVDLPIWPVLQVFDSVGALVDDRPEAIDLWFQQQVEGLPEPMVRELGRWFDIKKNGSATVPRSRPRSKTTLRVHLYWALPATRSWAGQGYESLREVTKDDILRARRADSQPSRLMQGLKSIFRTLKAHKVIFHDPTARIRTGEHPTRQPVPLDVAVIHERLNSPDPATAVITALIAFHGLRFQELQQIQLVDIQDGRLNIAGRSIPLADPARQHLDAYIAHRNKTWPLSTNPYLFINTRCWRQEQPCGRRWFKLTLGPGLTVRQLREDRIVTEALANGGDIRALCDLFGLSTNAASRYARVTMLDDLTDPYSEARHGRTQDPS